MHREKPHETRKESPLGKTNLEADINQIIPRSRNHSNFHNVKCRDITGYTGQSGKIPEEPYLRSVAQFGVLAGTVGRTWDS